MQPDDLFDEKYTDASPLLADIQALDRLAPPQPCDTKLDRVAQADCPLLDDLRAADRVLRLCDATLEEGRSEESQHPEEGRAQQVARWGRGTRSREDPKKNREPENQNSAPNLFRDPPRQIARAPPCARSCRFQISERSSP